MLWKNVIVLVMQEFGQSELQTPGRWIAYKTATKTQILDKLGLYITHLENAASIQVTEQKNAIELKVIWINGKIQKYWLTYVFISNVEILRHWNTGLVSSGVSLTKVPI